MLQERLPVPLLDDSARRGLPLLRSIYVCSAARRSVFRAECRLSSEQHWRQTELGDRDVKTTKFLSWGVWGDSPFVERSVVDRLRGWAGAVSRMKILAYSIALSSLGQVERQPRSRKHTMCLVVARRIREESFGEYFVLIINGKSCDQMSATT